MDRGIPYHDEVRARELQAKADKLTAFRAEKAKYVGRAISLSNRGWITTIAAGVLMATDYLDGYYAKKAQKIMNTKKPLTDGGTKDPDADKELMNALKSGLTARALREKDVKTIVALGSLQLVEEPRNRRMAASRATAEEEKLKIGISAMQKNRVKTVGQLASTFVLISPLSNNERVKDIALSSLAASTGLGYVGEREYSEIVQQQLIDKYVGSETGSPSNLN